jgi:alpha-beta hydrolase superfamily lysophospholipase
MPGFNEPMAKYVQTAFELYTSAAKVSVVLYDHRGQGLSDRSPNLPPTASQNGHFDDFDRECVADCVAMAKHASQVLGLSPGLADGKKEQEKKRLLHVVAHSMGGLIAVHAIANSPDLFTGRVVRKSMPFSEGWW